METVPARRRSGSPDAGDDRHGFRAGALPEPQHHAGAAVRRRQRHRHHDAPDRQRTRRRARRQHGDRQQGGRQRLDRGELCRPLRARRLHAVRDDEHVAFGQSVFAEEHDLRSGQGFHPDRADRRPALHAGDPSGRPGEFGGRTDRAGQEGAGQILLRQRQFLGDRRRARPSPVSPGSICFTSPTRARRRP